MIISRFAIAASLLAVAGAVSAQTSGTKTYIVQLADAPAASYAGTVSGLAATRPAPGARFDARAPNVLAYVNFLDARRNNTLALVGGAKVLHRYNVALNGFAAQLTDADVKALKRSANVVSVTESEIRKLDTTRTPAFLGLTAPGGLWSQLDASSRLVKGEDVIIGMIDSGVWPEDASFGDKQDGTGKPVAYNQAGTQVYGQAPIKWKGTCQTGPGFTSAMCNNKLIGARMYHAGFDVGGGTMTSFEYLSPRDGGGHGTHTSSTAGGNSNVAASISGVPAGLMSGIAPRARIATYKICWEATVTAFTGCYTEDTLAAIDDAVKDGVDVINFSISGTLTNFVDPVEIAFLNASAAGVFVSASAGNSGPANKVAHMSPWLTTVAASTHDRYTVASVTLGSGASFSGASYQGTGLPSTPMILSTNAGIANLTPTQLGQLAFCFGSADGVGALLDPSKVNGKVVVCNRGSNFLVNKAAAVQAAGGVAMIIQNTPTSNNSQVLQPYVIPAVHLDVSAYSTIVSYGALPGATASFGPGVQQSGVIAPVMASFSSRGPNMANGNILKPDITGPGVDIIAGFLDSSLTQAQHDALLLGNFTPQANATSLQGTSMSSPHMAGAAALLRQLHPTWSPAAVKSALMTSTNGVKLASGAPDLDRWGYGAGHMNPNGAGNPGLVYDAGPADYGRFLCGLALTPPAGIGTCATLGSIQPWNLTLASLTASAVPGTITLNRTVTNVSGATSTFVASSSLPGWNVVVVPSNLTLAAGASQSFTVTLTRTSAPVGAWTFGSLTWADNNSHTVVSPLSARAVGFVAPAEVSDTRASGKGTKVFTVVSAYTGSLTVTPTGLVPATRSAGLVLPNARQCFDFSVPAGAQVARFQLFNSDTLGGGSGTDIDLDVFAGPGGTGPNVGSSGGPTADEIVTLNAPAAGPYSACVTGFVTPTGGATFKLSSWIVGPAVGLQTLKASGPNTVYSGGTASIGLGWTVLAGARYLGNVQFIDNNSALIGSTIVYVDNH